LLRLRKKLIMLGVAAGGDQKYQNDEEDIDARLTKMLGGVGNEKEPLLKDGETAKNLMNQRMIGSIVFNLEG
jgi:hypothetical protein